MQKKKYIVGLLLCFSILLSGWIMPQKYVQAETQEIELCDVLCGNTDNIGYSAYLYNMGNGLPTSEATAVVQSQEGFIWIGGYSGLTRYDGRDFYRFDAETGIRSVASLYVDSKNQLWVGTNDRGIALYRENAFVFFDEGMELASGSVKAIAEDREGHIVFATTQGLACIDENYTLRMLEDERLADTYVASLTQDEQGILYGLTLSGDVFIMDNCVIQEYYKSSALGVSDISFVCGTDGLLWIGTESGKVLSLDCSGQHTPELISEHAEETDTCVLLEVETGTVSINQILRVSERYILVCSDGGIGCIDENNQYIKFDSLPMNNSVDDVIKDYEGNLWFASSRQGVMKIVKNRFQNLSIAAELKEMVINSTCMYQNKLYVGTDTGLVVLDEEHNSIDTELTKLLDGYRIRSIKADSKGNLWFCTYGKYGLLCLKKDGSYQTYTTDNGMYSNKTRTLLECSNGDIVVASTGGLNIIQNGKIIQGFASAEGLKNTEILSLCEGADGKLYAGSDGGGIYILTKSSLMHLGRKEGLGSDVILRLKLDPVYQGIWAITGNSIAYIKDEKVHTLEHFPYSNNYDIFFGDNGEAWILSSNGIYQVKGSDLVNDVPNMEYSLYDMSLGLPCSITANARHYQDADGTLYLCGSSYVFSFNMKQDESYFYQDKIGLVIPYVDVNGTQIFCQGETHITIPKTCKRLTIHGLAISNTLKNHKLVYWLEGFDDSPIMTTRQELEPISYTNLQGKTYLFHLGVLDTDTEEILQEYTLTIEKEKKLVEQPLFLCILSLAGVLLLVGGAALYVCKRTKEFEEKEKQNKLFIDQMLSAFSKAIDIKDKYTNGHSSRVSAYSERIARQLGLDAKKVENVKKIALLHDVGKVIVPDEILNKPAHLTDEEYQIIKEHTKYGYDILKEITSFPELADGALLHHERYEGKGYPSGVNKEKIPIIARIIAVADTFDAMNSTRPYRQKMQMSDIIAELRRVAGTQLDPEIVEALIVMIESGELDDIYPMA